LPAWLEESVLQQMAYEHNLAASVFIVKQKDKYHIRWFAPDYEIDLCGHGTFAAGYVVLSLLEPNLQEVQFHHSKGIFSVKRNHELLSLEFPLRTIEAISPPDVLIQGLGAKPIACFQYQKERCMAIFSSENEIKTLNPDQQSLKQLPYRGIIVSAPGKKMDFVLRVFYPHKTIFEDAVTGSAFCYLLPYWQAQLQKNLFHARQLSRRVGELIAEIKDNHAYISGKAVLYMQGKITSLA
jgi:PhzF family phenazine biosynthesis protein